MYLIVNVRLAALAVRRACQARSAPPLDWVNTPYLDSLSWYATTVKHIARSIQNARNHCAPPVIFFAHIGPRAVAAAAAAQRNARPKGDTGTRETGRWGNCHGVMLVDAESQKTAETSGAKATHPFALDTRDRLVYVRALP